MRASVCLGAFLFVACFPFGGETKGLPGPYSLEESEDHEVFWLHGPNEPENSGGGVLEGIVLQLGWNDEYILAYRYSTFRGDPDGWMVIDVKGRSLAGPFTEQQIKLRPELRTIHVYPVKEAWKKLGWL